MSQVPEGWRTFQWVQHDSRMHSEAAICHSQMVTVEMSVPGREEGEKRWFGWPGTGECVFIKSQQRHNLSLLTFNKHKQYLRSYLIYHIHLVPVLAVVMAPQSNFSDSNTTVQSEEHFTDIRTSIPSHRWQHNTFLSHACFIFRTNLPMSCYYITLPTWASRSLLLGFYEIGKKKKNRRILWSDMEKIQKDTAIWF